MRQSRYNVVVERDDRVWVYNGLSGMMLAVSREEWRDLDPFLGGDDQAPSAATLHDLTGARMLVTDDADELGVLERRYRASTRDPTSFALTIVTSLGCNFDCPYCFEAKVPSILDDETERLLLEVLDEQLPTLKTFYVTWYGGEPLLGQDRLDRLSVAFLERTAAAGVDYVASIVTNGYLLTPETAERLSELGVRSAQITLDGPPETHNRMRPLVSGRPTFDVILDNIERSADLLPIVVRVNLDTSNLAEADRLLDLLAERGLGGRVTVYPGRIIPIDDGAGAPSETYAPPCFTMPEFARIERTFLARARELGLAESALPQPVGSPCTAVRANELVVGARGELYKCWDSVGNASRGGRPPPLVARPERPGAQVAALRPLHRRGLPRVHRAARPAWAGAPTTPCSTGPATRSARPSVPRTASRSPSSPPPPRRPTPPACATRCCR